MNEQLKILVVEDNREHLNLTRYILRDNNVPGDVYVVRDGQEAIDYLYRKNRFADKAVSPRPNVVLLDLNLPRVDGKEVLRIIKNDSILKDIPVIVVSSSDREEDVSFASEMGAAAYISKSGGFEQLSKAIASIQAYVNKLKP
jgi:CheY-like chemotaxis protein